MCVQVSPSDASLITVGAPTSESHHDSIVQYPISLQVSPRLWDRGQLEASIEVKCILTGQKQVIPIRVQLIGHRDDPQNGELYCLLIIFKKNKVLVAGSHKYHTKRNII